MHSKHDLLYGVIAIKRPFVYLPCILARSDCVSSAKSIVFDDCSDMSEKIIHRQVTVRWSSEINRTELRSCQQV